MVNIHGVDTSKIRIGDKIHIEYTVRSIDGDLIHGNTEYSYGWSHKDTIVKHVPAPKSEPKIGDEVRIRSTGSLARIIAISDDKNYFWLHEYSGDLWSTFRRNAIIF